MKSKNLWARRVGRLLGALVVMSASGLSLAAIDLNPTFTGPATYTPGTNDASYTLTVANNGGDPEDDASIATNFPGTVNVTWTCTAGANSACPASGNGNLSGAGFEIADGESLSFAILADFDSAMTDASLVVTATVDDSATPSVQTNDSHTSTLSLSSDLTLGKSASPSTYTPGESSNFTVTVANAGPSDAAGVTLVDNAPTGASISGWSCTPASACPAASGPAGNISETLDVPAGQTAMFIVTVAYPSSLQTETSTNTATMTVPANLNDPDGSDPVDATASLTRAAESDLSLAFTGTVPTTFIPGAAAGTDFQFTVTNGGPSDTAGAVLPLRWGDLAASVSWSCAPLAACSAVGQIEVPDEMGGTVFEPTDNTAGDGAGTGDEDLIVDLAASGSVVISATLQYASSARSDYVYSPAVFASADDPPVAADEPDPDTSNNSATLTLTPNRQADIAVDKIALPTVNPGSSFAYDIVVSNLGPSDLGSDPLVSGSAGEIGILLEDIFDASLLGGLGECADTSAPCWSACTSDSGGDPADTDFDLTNCPTPLVSSGGDIQDLGIALKAGHSTLVRAFVRTDENASGQVDNTATVTLDPADGVTEPAIAGVTDNNSDPVTSVIDRSSDLSVTKTDGVTTAVAGEEHSYTIVVENNGFITANAVELEDQLPTFDEADFAAGLTSAGFMPNSPQSPLTWQCQAFDGACCNTNSTICGAGQPIGPISIVNDPVEGNVLRNKVDLPGRSRVEFTVTGTLDPRASGTLSNTAEIFPPADVNDPLDTNDTDIDDDTQLERQAAITVTKSLTTLVGVDTANPESPPFALTYAIVVENNGPSYVPGVRVVDPLSDTDFDQSTADWECAVDTNPGQTACASATGTGTLDTTVDLDPGGEISFIVRVETEATASGSVTNTARAELQSGEQFFSEAVRTSLIGTAELIITKTDNRAELAPGDPVTYSIKVRNEGPDDVLNATVVDEFPLVIDSLAWSCQAVTPVPGDISPLRPLVPGFTPGNGLVTSPDGRHVYVIGTSTGRLFAFDRNNVPGAGFGDVTLIETEINGVDDTGDAGAVVSGMDRPLDIVMSPDGFNVYALSKPETVPEFGLVDQFATSRWSTSTQTFGCGSSSVSADSASVELATANGCAAISASYIHDGVDEAGTVTFDWSVDQSQAHSYEARAGVSGDTLQTLTTDTPATGTASIAVVPGDQVIFNVFKNSGFGISTLRISNFEFVPADAAPPTIAAFARSTNPAASNFGELMFLGSFNEGVPEEPVSFSMSNGNLYVAGAGNPDNVDDEGDPIADSDVLISIFDRDPISGLPIHDFIQLADVPSNVGSLVVDPAGDYLFAGGDSLQMFTIDEAQAGLPAGRLTAVPNDLPRIGNLAFGTGINSLVAVDDAPHLYARAVVGGSSQLVMVRFLDTDGNHALSLDFNYTAAGLGLPANAISSAGSIAVSPDGEHVAGVSADDDLLYVLRRDDNPEPGGGGLSFQESRASVIANDENSGLILASDVVFAPDGRHVLVAPAAGDENTNPALAVFNRRAPDPLFAFLENDRQSDANVSGITAPNDIAVSPDGAHVYSVSLPDNSLTRFNRFPRLGLTEDTQGMHLQYAETYADGFNGVSGLAQPRRVLISPDGESVFVTSEANDTIAVFTRDNDKNSPQYGELDFVEVIADRDAGIDGLNGAQGMAMDPSSRHLYVAGTFDNAIARFERDPVDGTLTWRERVVSGENGVVGLSGIRDIAVTADGRQLLGVSTNSNALVVFDRDFDSGSSSFGELTFVQAQLTSIGVRPVALALPNGSAALGKDAHVYVVGQNSNTLAVLRRVTDASSSAFGQVQPIDVLTSGQDGIAFMQGPNDVQVSPDGKRVYVAAEASDAVLVFDRDLNVNSSNFGVVSPVEIRRDSVRGVDGIREVRALGVSADSRNVYAAGYGEAAVASFRLGTGSVCTAGGSGTINDQVDIGVGGTIEYRATGVVRPGATGFLVNTASVAVPENFIALNPQTGCPNGGDYCATDSTQLVPEGSVTIEKVADNISFVAGSTAAYTVTINNAGPSSLVNSASSPLNVSDLLDDNDAFVDGSAVWRCEATGSGSLEFLDAYRNLDPEDATTGPFDSLEGISGLTLVPGTPGNWLVGASVLDDSLSVFTRDAITGELLTQTTLSAGDTLGAEPVDFLNGVQSVVASADGAFLYLASRASDAV
ncbi:MAG TPA: beta-propeller fold lactonase family protein, partial [Wenzhouxiangellaceae bacterium]|nr:beta-propeller fold lactonase family protein [Wenzhouxiangellaceae bacterium]